MSLYTFSCIHSTDSVDTCRSGPHILILHHSFVAKLLILSCCTGIGREPSHGSLLDTLFSMRFSSRIFSTRFTLYAYKPSWADRWEASPQHAAAACASQWGWSQNLLRLGGRYAESFPSQRSHICVGEEDLIWADSCAIFFSFPDYRFSWTLWEVSACYVSVLWLKHFNLFSECFLSLCCNGSEEYGTFQTKGVFILQSLHSIDPHFTNCETTSTSWLSLCLMVHCKGVNI